MSKESWRSEFKHSQAVTHLVIDGKQHERLRVDAEEDNRYDCEDEYYADRCGHCEASDGDYHLLGCEEERCPRCRRQLISCACEVEPIPGEPPKWRTRRAKPPL